MAIRTETKECVVSFYIERVGLLAINFDGFGIAFDGVAGNYKTGDTVEVRYSGKIGTKNFKIELLIENKED